MSLCSLNLFTKMGKLLLLYLVLLHAIIVVFQYKGLMRGLVQENKIVMSL